MRSPLDKSLRKQLERAVEKARDIAELAAREELERLAVGENSAPDYLTESQRELRNRLRAHARQLGDTRRTNGEQGITLLVTEVAYQHWHRMLFSRFLAENNLLMYEDGVTPLSIGDCFELAEEETGDSTNGWRYAAAYAARMLPQIFRNDSPVYELEFAPNHQKKLEQLLEAMDESIFQAQDSLGWVYQFWQSKRKDEVNASEVKIGARELSPVTQLFTEPYMVSFLLDNALGAWWANQVLTEQDYATAQSEQALRDKTAIEGVPVNYLRFVKAYTLEQQALMGGDNPPEEKPVPEGVWEPAAGKFEQWPDDLAKLKALDPCCGSGHFLVSVFLMLVPIRMQREGLDEQRAIEAVLSQNIFGLELDERCVEIAAFALALEAWRYPAGGGYRQLPELNLACSGLSVKAAKEEWKQLGLGKKNLTIALDWLHREFSDASFLGSLINPAKSSAASIISWDELLGTLNQALEKESEKGHHSEGEQQNLEAAVAAQGLAKAAMMLASKYDWVITNVPYKVKGDLDVKFQDYLEVNFPFSKAALETVFLERCIDFSSPNGVVNVVLPQNMLFLSSYKGLREKLLLNNKWNLVAWLGEKAFRTPVDASPILLSIGNDPTAANDFSALDLAPVEWYYEKDEKIKTDSIKRLSQRGQLENPDFRVLFEDVSSFPLLSEIAFSNQGIPTSDSPLFVQMFWEQDALGIGWEYFQSTVSDTATYDGRSYVVLYENGRGRMRRLSASQSRDRGRDLQGKNAWGRKGISINLMGRLSASIYSGDKFDINIGVIIPRSEGELLAIWTFCSSKEFDDAVRVVDKKRNVTIGTLVKIPFDLKYWRDKSLIKFPNGLPKCFTDDPSQWGFHGHPCGSVVWDENAKWTANSDCRTDDKVLQVAVARLLGYQWPAELDPKMELAEEQREWVEEARKLTSYVDDDGIVCLPAIRGEKAADQRLEELLQASYGNSWSSQTRNKLLESVGCKNKTLAYWLREKFFEQHCKLFQSRPFIWQIWDGLKDGFSALVNYHQLDRKNLDRLIYTYLDDWIRTQTHQQSEGIDGASERLAAAQNLKQHLELILEGEKTYDIFVRWKYPGEQPIGWNPDLNDGVRLNIRPFMKVHDVGKKGSGILRAKPNIDWRKDRGKDADTAPWYSLGLEYGGKEGDRTNEHHLTLAEKQAARDAKG